jgi:protoporphyrinogen/coproporphyrinogen III oxidase
MNECYHAVIIGGGISGLSSAFFLSQRAFQEGLSLKITILEASDHFGGVLRTLSHEDLLMEAGADALYVVQDDDVELFRELDLQEDVVAAAPCFQRFFYLKNKKFFPIQGFPKSSATALGLLGNPRLSFLTKCRMLEEPFIRRRKEGGDESLANFIRRRLGHGFYQEVVKPLAQGVYMMDPEWLSVGALFPKLQQAEKIHGSLTGFFLARTNKKKKGSLTEFITLKHGLEGLAQAFERKLGGYELRRSAPVRSCSYDEGWKIFMENGNKLQADILGLAMNTCDASRLFFATVPELSRALSVVRYDSIVAVNLIYKFEDIPLRDMEPGFLVPADGGKYPFSSLKWLGRSGNGKYALMRAFLSDTLMPGTFHKDDETLRRELLSFLSVFFGVRTLPLFIDITRYPEALPQYEVGHLERVAEIEETSSQYPGLFITGNGFYGFGIMDCIRQARISVSKSSLSIF